jgi:hypothetical protein
MSQASPGFNFVNNIMKDATGPSMNMGPPPAPVETKSMPFSGERPGNNTMNFMTPPTNRPDISMGRGASATGIDISQQYEQVNRPMSMPSVRPEMKGPQTDIDSILSGLKTRSVDIQPPTQQQEQSDYGGADDSMISISSLKDMQDASMPRRRRRNNGSRGNTVSLDI